jgi:hypothetical protein
MGRQKPAAEGDYLHELGKTTQEIVSLVQEHQKNSGSGGVLPVPGCNIVRLSFIDYILNSVLTCGSSL